MKKPLASLLDFAIKPMARILGRAKNKNRDAEPPQPEEIYNLSRILNLVCRRPGHHRVARLMTRRMNSERVLFCTRDQVDLGDDLIVSLLIHNGRLLEFKATVRSVAVKDSLLLGELELEPEPNVAGSLRVYLQRLACSPDVVFSDFPQMMPTENVKNTNLLQTHG